MKFKLDIPVPVIIPVFGRGDVFRTMPLLRDTAYSHCLHFIVIDNGNEPCLSRRLAALAGPGCEVIRFDENRGGSAAYIAGMKRAMELPGGYAWLLDDDALPNAETLPALVEEMERLRETDGHVASVGSAVRNCAGEVIECGARFVPLLGHAFPSHRGGRVDFCAACSLLVNKAAVKACGFWEDVFIHFDDIEWGTRCTRMGWHNHATLKSTVVHPPFDPEKAGDWVCYFDARNQYWLAAKYGWLHVAVAYLKNLVKNLRDRLVRRHLDRAKYRALAWSDYKHGIRRTKAGLPCGGESVPLDMSNPYIIVAAHQPYWMPGDDAYLPLHVGAAGKGTIGFRRDDEGENISARNANWCELTGLYWAWKNLKCDYLGLVHYRRHFKGAHGVLTGVEARALLARADVVLPKKRNYWIETNYSQYAHAHHAVDLDLTRTILAERCPEYLPFWDASMKSTKGHRFNMFIMKRESADRYCAWLFDVLFELERRLDISSYSKYDSRVFGFVAERLLDPWIAKNGMKYIEVPVWNLESQHWMRKLGDFMLRKLKLGGKHPNI